MPIPSQKFIHPNLPTDLIQRAHLDHILLNGLEEKARLFLIIAPPGYGKSTSISQWIQDHRISHAWLNLDDPENDAYRFFSAMLDSIHASESFGKNELHAQSTIGSHPITTDELVQQIIHELNKVNKTYLFVLDRFEKIDSSTTHDLVFSMIEQLPLHASIVLISRKTPSLPISRMRAHNQLTELGEGNLRFTPEETRHFLEKKLTYKIPQSNLDALDQKIQGWPAGLRLAVDALWNDLKAENSLAVANFNGSHRHVADYFSEEIFSKAESDLQAFMVKSSAWEQFSAALCHSVMKIKNVDGCIDQLEENHWFISAVEDEQGWYRYHPLFRDYLNSKCDPEEKQKIYQSTAFWFQQQERFHDAVYYGLKSGNEQIALQIIEPACEGAILAGEIEIITEWLEQWTRNGFHPRSELLAYQGWIKALQGDFVKAQILAEQAYELLKSREKIKSKDLSQSIQITRGKLAALRAFSDVMYSHQYDRALKQAKIAQKLLPKNRSAWTLMALWSQAETQKRVDHISKSIETLYEALRIGKTTGGQIFYSAIANSLAAALHFNAQRNEALSVCQETIARGIASQTADSSTLGGLYAWIGRLYFESNQLDQAQEFIEKGIRLNEQAGTSLNLIFAHYYASQIYQANNQPERAMQSIQYACSLAGKASLSDECWLDAWEANLNLKQGNLIKVEHWIRREGPALNQKPDYLNMEMMIVYARYLIGIGETNLALKRLQELEKYAARRGYFRWSLTIYLLQAAIWDRKSKKPQALDCIKRAIHIAAPEEYYRAFLEEDKAILKLVPELSAESPAFVMRLLRFATSHGKDKKQIPASILPEPLSDRENEVLKLLVSGKKGPQIAEELFIAYSTVRTHLKSIHRKLDVHDRQELLDKVRLLELV